MEVDSRSCRIAPRREIVDHGSRAGKAVLVGLDHPPVPRAFAMPVAAAPAEPVSLMVDRPFIYARRDMETGAIVFLGRITEPEVRS